MSAPKVKRHMLPTRLTSAWICRKHSPSSTCVSWRPCALCLNSARRRYQASGTLRNCCTAKHTTHDASADHTASLLRTSNAIETVVVVNQRATLKTNVVKEKRAARSSTNATECRRRRREVRTSTSGGPVSLEASPTSAMLDTCAAKARTQRTKLERRVQNGAPLEFC